MSGFSKYYMGNSNLFLPTGDSTGIVKSFEIDPIKSVTEKYESLGMLFDKDVPVGFAQMAGKFTFAGPTPDFFTNIAFPWSTSAITMLGVMTEKSLSSTANNQQFECDMIIRPTELGAGKYENQKLTEFDRTFMIDKITILMGGVEQLAIDTENNIYRVLGVDQWASFRQLLGQ